MKTFKNILVTLYAIASICASSAYAALLITDPGFEGGSFTDVGDPFSDADSANFDKWVFLESPLNPPREWSMPLIGGNTGGYADGTFGNSASYKRTMFQAVTDDKATTGLMDLTFDLNLVNNEGGSESVVVGVWGVVTSGTSFSLDTAPGPTFGSNAGNAISLATQSFSTDTSGWEQQIISNIDFGTGYDLVIIGFQSNNFSDSSTVGIDNVAVIPEPGTLALVAGSFLALFALRGRKRS